MINLKATSWGYPLALLLPAILLIVVYGCAPKAYLSSYSDRKFNPTEIKTVTIVLDNANANNVLFAEIFTQIALERRKFFLARKDHIMQREMKKQDLRFVPDAFLKISLVSCHSGRRTYYYPTSVSAYAKLFEARTGRIIWKMNYAYESAKGGAYAPMIEEVMKIVAEKLIDSVPLTYTVPSVTALEKLRNVLPNVTEPSPKKILEAEKDYSKEVTALRSEIADLKEKMASQDEKRVSEIKLGKSDSGKQQLDLLESLTPFKNGPFLIHVSSVQKSDVAEKFVDRKTNDGTIHLATLVTLPKKGRWYRLLVGRFKTLNAAGSHIQKLKQSGVIGGYARPVKLPFTLLISTGQSLVSSQRKIQALRNKHLLAYLSPSAGNSETYDILLGAYGSEKEATQCAKIALKNGISAKTVCP